MAHETSTGSSPIVKGLINNLREVLPERERETLDSYQPQAAATTPKGDSKRARYCLHWAIQTAERPEHSHLARLVTRIKETHQAYKDVWLGTEFGTQVELGRGVAGHDVKGDQKIGPGEDVELLWVEEATDVAKNAAAESGWGSVPWEELLRRVIEID
jgi:hypothetical protein